MRRSLTVNCSCTIVERTRGRRSNCYTTRPFDRPSRRGRASGASLVARQPSRRRAPAGGSRAAPNGRRRSRPMAELQHPGGLTAATRRLELLLLAHGVHQFNKALNHAPEDRRAADLPYRLRTKRRLIGETDLESTRQDYLFHGCRAEGRWPDPLGRGKRNGAHAMVRRRPTHARDFPASRALSTIGMMLMTGGFCKRVKCVLRATHLCGIEATPLGAPLECMVDEGVSRWWNRSRRGGDARTSPRPRNSAPPRRRSALGGWRRYAPRPAARSTSPRRAGPCGTRAAQHGAVR